MAELSPHNALINDLSADKFIDSADLHASHIDSESAVTDGPLESAHQLLQPPHDSETPSLGPNSSQDHGHLNLTINRDVDNATPDQQGSDTDSGRPDASKVARSGSVKKPLSFKPVSITKSFLAKSATTPGSTPPPVKLAEKRTPTAPNSPKTHADTSKASPQMATLQLNARPRLIAKTGSSGLRDIPRTRSGDGTSTPDARTVWNKNQRQYYPHKQHLVAY
jgi:hypothetical protein